MAATSDASLLGAIADRMRHLGARGQVIAGNIANADTPGFQALVLVDRGSSDGRIARPRVQPSAEMLARGAREPRGGRVIVDPAATERKPNGNTVTLEEQLLALGQTQADYALLANLYRKQRSLIATALGKGAA